MIANGTVVADRYEVEALLGAGGLAEVYRVRHIALGSMHALKVLVWDRRSLDRRLLLEGRIQAQLRHRNVVAVTDVLSVQGKAALLMEYVDGPNLNEWLDATGTPDEEQALELFAAILAAVVRAHDAGVTHRDLKPHNILLESKGSTWIPKVTDFGLAKVMAEELAASATRTNMTMGTPGYMAPEQVRDASKADARTDVFSLGVLLHELFSGTSCFANDEGVLEVTATLEREPAPLGDAPERVQEVVAKALNKEPELRYADARDMADALYSVGDPLRDEVLALSAGAIELDENKLTPGPNTWRSPPTQPPPSTPPPATQEASSSRPWLWLVGAAVLALPCVGATGWWIAMPDSAPPTPQVQPVVTAPPPSPAPVPTAQPTAPEVEAAAAPTPAPAAAPTVAPVAPEPAPETASDPAEIAPEPAPEPAPSVVITEIAPPEPEGTEASEEELAAERQAAVEKMTRMLVGTWKGTAQGRPFQVRITSASPELVRGELIFNPGPAQRTSPVSGSYTEGRLSLSGGDLSVTATVDGDELAGSYQRGKKPIAFQTTR